MLLPFTGPDSGTASNFERSVLYARDRINRGGGINGRPVRIVSQDTHSDVERAKQSVDALVAAGAIAVIGPEDADIAAQVKPILDRHDIVFLSPLIGAADDTVVDCEKPWFRLAPSARTIGEALAKEVIGRSFKTAAVLHTESAYDSALSKAFISRFTGLGGQISLNLLLSPDAPTYAAAIGQLQTAQADAVMLATRPRAGALLVNEATVLNANERWFFSPLLKTDLFLLNVIALDPLEGATGVTPKIYDTTGHFPAAFGQRWLGDQPLEGAFFYYDAMALLAFGLTKASLADGSIHASELRAAIVDSAGTMGQVTVWNEIEDSLALLRQDEDVFYSGLTGPLLILSCGHRKGGGAYSSWQIEGGTITVSD